MAVSHKISSAFPDAALLRRHQPPVIKALESAATTLAKAGMTLDLSSAKSLNESFIDIKDPVHQLIARLTCIKSMKRAEYFCTGSVEVSTFSHYALSVPLYTHFTSPIRRYCDLVVHRLLECCMDERDNLYNTERVGVIAKRCNERKFAARAAQDASQNLFLCVHLAELQKDLPNGIIVDAYITEIKSVSFNVLISRYGIEAGVWLEDSLNAGEIDGLSCVENTRMKIHWKGGEQSIGVFDLVKVKIVVDMTRSPPAFRLYAVSPHSMKDNDKI